MRRPFFILGVLLALVGCGGGEPDEPAGTHFYTAPTGIWLGSFYSDADDELGTESMAVVANNGVAFVSMANGSYWHGEARQASTNLATFSLINYSDDLSSNGEAITLTGVIDASPIRLSDAEGSYLQLEYSNLSERSSSIEAIAGAWAFTIDNTYSININIASDGRLSGAAFTCSSVSGQVEIITPIRNMYAVSISLCEVSYNGLIFLAGDASTNSEVLTMGVANDTEALLLDGMVREL